MNKGIFKYLNIEISKAEGSAGFVMLFAVTLASIILAIALGVANISLKEIKFSTSAKDTNEAFFAADTGIEQALFNDKTPENYPPPVSGVQSWSFVVAGLGSGNTGCANVMVSKEIAGTGEVLTTVVSKGYNVGNVSCDSSNPDRIERQLRVSYTTSE